MAEDSGGKLLVSLPADNSRGPVTSVELFVLEDEWCLSFMCLFDESEEWRISFGCFDESDFEERFLESEEPCLRFEFDEELFVLEDDDEELWRCLEWEADSFDFKRPEELFEDFAADELGFLSFISLDDFFDWNKTTTC